MVNVAGKQNSLRIAVASGFIHMQPKTLAVIMNREADKGDVLGVARIAAIMGAKQTAGLIPLCHPIMLTRIAVDFSIHDGSIECRVQTETIGKTGVEMEALTAVQIGLLTVYDMLKAIDRNMIISNIRLLEKQGGNSGTWYAE